MTTVPSGARTTGHTRATAAGHLGGDDCGGTGEQRGRSRRQQKPVPRAALGAAVLLFLGPAPAEATHAVDHRYVVLGYVRDGAGRPVSGTEVLVSRERTGLVYRERTDADGFYAVIVHLHSEDLQDPLQVTTGRAAVRIEARFNPLNVRTERGTRVDVTGYRAAERQEMFAETLEAYLKR